MRTLSELIDILLPRVCAVCQRPLVRGEDVMCLNCLADMPLTQIHRFQPNALHERLVSLKSKVERGASMFYYHRRNPYTRLIISSKYHGRPSIGRKLARMFADELVRYNFFESVDIILPIPVHFTKLLTRGFNQSEFIAKGIGDVTGIPVGDNLYARLPHVSQTRKSGSERREITNNFRVKRPGELTGKHILIVDDVITTGSTVTSALDAIHTECKGVKTSVLSLGLTQND